MSIVERKKRRGIFRIVCLTLSIICCLPAFIGMMPNKEAIPLSEADINNVYYSHDNYVLDECEYSVISTYHRVDESFILQDLWKQTFFYHDILFECGSNKYVISVKSKRERLENSDHIPIRVCGYISELSDDVCMNRTNKEFREDVHSLNLCINDGMNYMHSSHKILLYVGIFFGCLFYISMFILGKRTVNRRRRI